jgi:glycosyltransferase involved in cell wall biosynthesis
LRPQFIGIISLHILALLKLIIIRKRFDVVHIHGDWSSIVLANLIKKISRSKKLIMTIHGNLSNNLYSKKALALLLPKVDLLFATGHGLASELREITSKQVIVQPSGIRNIFYNNPYKKRNKINRVVVVSNLVKIKNLDLVIDIAKELKFLNFTIVGDGPEKNHLLNRIKIESVLNVHMTGFKSSIELHSIYSKSDAFLLTSSKEGTPTAMLEAMACGLPIVTSNVGGVEKILGNHNFISKKNELHHYIDCFDNLIAKKDLLNQIAKDNISISLEYNWNIVAKNINKHLLKSN